MNSHDIDNLSGWWRKKKMNLRAGKYDKELRIASALVIVIAIIAIIGKIT